MEFNQEDRMKVVEVFEGVSREDIQSKCAFELDFAASLKISENPAEKHVRLLRDKLDPKGLYI